MPASRDDDVYQAKLAEQAERYEGKKQADFYFKHYKESFN
jgi:hypothetical protein